MTKERTELIKALQENNVDIEAYFGCSIVGNHCTNVATNGDKIMDATSKAVFPKITDADNQSYLSEINVQVKKLLKIWYELQRTMKSAKYQTDDDCKKNLKEHS